VHVRGTAVPAGAAAIEGRLPGPGCIEPHANQMLRASKWALPVSPEERAQLSPDPAIEFLQHATYFYEAEVDYPTRSTALSWSMTCLKLWPRAPRNVWRIFSAKCWRLEGAIFSFGFRCHVTL
jgi:hypothetical protein